MTDDQLGYCHDGPLTGCFIFGQRVEQLRAENPGVMSRTYMVEPSRDIRVRQFDSYPGEYDIAGVGPEQLASTVTGWAVEWAEQDSDLRAALVFGRDAPYQTRMFRLDSDVAARMVRRPTNIGDSVLKIRHAHALLAVLEGLGVPPGLSSGPRAGVEEFLSVRGWKVLVVRRRGRVELSGRPTEAMSLPGSPLGIRGKLPSPFRHVLKPRPTTLHGIFELRSLHAFCLAIVPSEVPGVIDGLPSSEPGMVWREFARD